MKARKYIFIGGTGRSGTTILSDILGTSKSIYKIPYEMRLHVDPGGIYNLYRTLCCRWDLYNGDFAVRNFSKLYRDIFMKRYGHYNGVKLQAIGKKNKFEIYLSNFLKDTGVKKNKSLWYGNESWTTRKLSGIFPQKEFYKKNFYLTKKIDKNIFSNAVKKLYDSIFSQVDESIEFIVDHTPYNFIYFDKLHEIIPNSYFIHIYRNPLDVVASYKNQTWGNNSLEHNVTTILNLFDSWNKSKKALNNYIEVKLEELDEEKEINLIKEYLDVYDFDTSYYKNSKINSKRWIVYEDEIRALENFEELKNLKKNLNYK